MKSSTSWSSFCCVVIFNSKTSSLGYCRVLGLITFSRSFGVNAQSQSSPHSWEFMYIFQRACWSILRNQSLSLRCFLRIDNLKKRFFSQNGARNQLLALSCLLCRMRERFSTFVPRNVIWFVDFVNKWSFLLLRYYFIPKPGLKLANLASRIGLG